MLFNSYSFIFLFLPAALTGYFASGPRWTAISRRWYGWRWRRWRFYAFSNWQFVAAAVAGRVQLLSAVS